MTDRWLSVAEIAQHLGVKKVTVYKWVRKRRMLPKLCRKKYKGDYFENRLLQHFRTKASSIG